MLVFFAVYGMGVLASLVYMGGEARNLEREERMSFFLCVAWMSLLWPLIFAWLAYEALSVWVHIKRNHVGLPKSGGSDEH